MKQFRKIAGVILLASLLVVSMAITAFATDITISGGANGSEYAAYKLLNATDGGEGKFAYTLNEKYEAILVSVTGKDTRADIVDYISNLSGEGIRDFADAVYAEISEADPKIAADYNTDSDVFTDVEQGYYLIAETKVGNAEDTFSLVLLYTAGEDSIDISTKEDKPTVEKKIESVDVATGNVEWVDSADYAIGDVINYRITGTVSSKYADYLSYYYDICDTMEVGLTFNNDAKIYVVNGDNEVDVTAQFIINTTTDDETDNLNGFSISKNLKELTGVTINASTKIVVEYTATLNEHAIHGAPGNKNVVFLLYENNPYVDGDGNPETPDKPEEPGETPEDINIVFTFKANVDKVDKDNNALNGAGFTLYKWVVNGIVNEDDTTSDGWVLAHDEIMGDTMSTFVFEGLDTGKYKLVESTIPAGFNKCEDIIFEIVAEYNLNTAPNSLTALKVLDEDGAETDSFDVSLQDGVISTIVVNLSGTELPSTGGIGTPIFYIIGGLLAVGAIVLLIAKKRMKAE